MAQIPNLYFVSAGGEIEGHDEITYPSLLQLIARSRFRDRFVMLGWRPSGEIPTYIGQADVGLTIDGKNVEAELGTRTRMMGWAAAGLPIVSTAICEFACELRRCGLLYDFAPGDPTGLSSALVSAARDPEERMRRRAAAADYVSREYHWRPATQPLVNWCRLPRPSPDRGKPRAITDTKAVTYPAFFASELWRHWRSRGMAGLGARCSHFIRKRVRRLSRSSS
jgi:hypothetical protein